MSSTSRLAEDVRNLGYSVSSGSLRQDSLAGLVTPTMPAYVGPGRGHSAEWSVLARRRVLHLARLRRLAVDGRAIPILLYLRDGWGWPNIAPFVAKQTDRLALLDKKSLRASRIRDRADLEDLAAQPTSIEEPARTGALLEARRYLLSAILSGEPLADSSMIPYARLLLDELRGATSRSIGDALGPDGGAVHQAIENARRAWGLAQADLGSWLREIDEATADRGRRWLLHSSRLLRPLAAEWRIGPSSNPLSCFGKPLSAVRAELRGETGRPTAAQVLSAWLAQSIFAAELLRRAGVEVIE